MSLFYFFLGNTPQLSLLELSALYPGDFTLVDTSIASFAGELDLSTLVRLGGTRKVAEVLTIVSPKQLDSELAKLMTTDPAKNIAVTDYKSGATVDLKKLKKEVTTTRSIRLVSMETKEHELLMLDRQHVTEFNLVPQGGDIAIAKTVWIHNAQDWVSRDRRKPYRDIKRGMLPPKLARIMVNLATLGRKGLTLADPFCGTGTILTEAMSVGCQVIGADNSPEAVKGAATNCAWIASTPGSIGVKFEVLVADATHFGEQVKSADVIVTEPYMGPLLDERNPSSLDRIKNVAKGLDKLYRGALKSWYKVLPQDGRVVMSIPSFHVYNRIIPTISIDTLVTLGYNHLATVPYSKPGAAVVRNITILEKK